MLNICSHGAGNAFCGHNSKALIDGTKYTSFGGYTRKTNAISSPKSYLKQNPHGRRPLTSEIWWPHHETCALYNEPLESSYHHCLACPFAQVVWFQVLSWEPFDTLADWWENTLLLVPQERERAFNDLAIYTMRNLWKERNHRIFDATHATVPKLLEGSRKI